MVAQEVSVIGRGVADFGDGVVGGIYGHAKWDFGDGNGPVNACKLKFSDPAATSTAQWLTVGSTVECGGRSWTITYISDPSGGDAVVDLESADPGN